MLHGHTRITLRNPLSGNILKDIESENTFQPTVLQNFSHCLGEDLHNIPSYNWEDLVGGIFLFRDAIDSLVPYMPATNVMIGNSAVGITNADLPNELGTYNSVDSKVSASAIKQIYDFETNQANGTISCVSLTSKVGGQIGYGNESGRRTDVELATGQTASFVSSGNAVVVNNILYSFSISGDTLTVEKTKKSLTQGSVFRGFSTSVDIDLTNIKPSGSTLSATIGAFALNDNKIRVYSQISNMVASGDAVNFFDYDPTDDSVVLGSFTNTAEKTIRTDTQALSFTPDNYCITYDSERYLQVFNVSNSTHVLDYTVERLLANERNGNYDTPLSNGLLLAYGSGNGYMLNYIAGTVKPINVSGSSNYSIHNKRYPSIDAIYYTSGDQTGMCMIKNPLYLATINNLPSPVTKTAAQTMKVTYTLTES